LLALNLLILRKLFEFCMKAYNGATVFFDHEYLSMAEDLTQWQSLIGYETDFRGRRYRVVELLEDGPALILQAIDSGVIQTNQFGEAQRRVAENFVIPIYGADGVTLNSGFTELDLHPPKPTPS
jgi:hypothetical protein